MCPICWAVEHPLEGYCMLCAEPVRKQPKENTLCPKHRYEFLRLFGERRELKQAIEIREVMAFVAQRIYSNIDSLEALARRQGGAP